MTEAILLGALIVATLIFLFLFFYAWHLVVSESESVKEKHETYENELAKRFREAQREQDR